MYTLDQESQHFNELKKNVLGISPKVLSQKLKILERDGFLMRTIHEDNVIRVEYALTEIGKRLCSKYLSNERLGRSQYA